MSKFGPTMAKGASKAADSAGRSVGSRMSSGIGKTLKRGAQVAGAGVAGILGTALYKGFQRLQGIDQAEAKLRGLGHSAQGVEKIMGNALNSVKGTAFGLDAAATTAAGAVAAGVKPGKDLERTLKLVADTATIAGVGMDEMGAIFNKVASSDMIQGDVLAQLGDKGIPVLQMLSKEMGKPVAKVRELASKGKVDFATFQSAMEAGLGGAAQESGKTFAGALANTQAALGRLGATILGPIFKRIPGVLDGLIGKIDSLSPVAERAGVLLGEAFVWFGDALQKHVVPPLQSFGGFLTGSVVPALVSVGKWLNENRKVVVALGVAVGAAYAATLIYSGTVKVVTAVTKAWTVITNLQTYAQKALNAVLRLNPIGVVVTALVLLGAALVVAYKKSETFRDIVDGAWARIKQTIQVAWHGVIKPVLKAWWAYLTNVLFPVIKFLWENVVRPVFTWIGGKIRDTWNGVIKPALTNLWAYLTSTLFPAINRFWSEVVKPVMKKVGEAIERTWKVVIKPTFEALRDFITDKVEPAFRKGVNAIKAIWEGLGEAASKPVEFLVNVVYMKGIRKVINLIPGVPDLPAMHFGGSSGGGGGRSTAGGITKAQGGVLPGWTPGRDVHDFYSPTAGWLHLSGGEAIMRPEFTRAMGGPTGIDRLNAWARRQRFASGGIFRPVPGGYPSTRPGHSGVDVAVPVGTKVASVADGTVTASYDIPGHEPRAPHGGLGYKSYGRVIKINHGGFSSLYAHLSSRGVSAGTKVAGGRVIGLSGNTGYSTGPHLHFESPGANPFAFFTGGSTLYHGTAGKAGQADPLARFKKAIDAGKDFASNIGGWVKKIGGMGPWGGMFATATKSIAGSVRSWINDKIPGPGPIPSLFDRGGWLPHGGMAVNLSGRPEPVLTNAQWSSLRTATQAQLMGGGALTVKAFEAGTERLEAQMVRMNEKLDAVVTAAGVTGPDRAADKFSKAINVATVRAARG